MGAVDTLAAWGHSPSQPWVTALIVYVGIIWTVAVLFWVWRSWGR